jgi:hypothetical protein
MFLRCLFLCTDVNTSSRESTHRIRDVIDVATHASNKHTSIGRSGVDASRKVLSVASPPGLLHG